MVISKDQLSLTLLKFLREHNSKGIFLVHGHKSFEDCGAAIVFNELRKDYPIVEFNDFSSNPKKEDVDKGVFLFKHSNMDTIVSVGGGSCIDMAKLIRYYYIRNSDNTNKSIPLVAIATTAGTGAEETQFAVCYVDGKKTSVDNYLIKSDLGIICPEFTFFNNRNLTACTGFDALAQAIEAYWNVNATLDSDKLAIKAIKNLLKPLELLVNNLGDKILRSKVAEGASFAGQAINITRTTAPHAMSYTLTSLYKYPHGHAVALTFPYFFQENLLCTQANYEGDNYNYYQSKMLYFRGYINKMNNDIITDRQLFAYMKRYTKNLGLGYDSKRKIDISEVINGINMQRAKNNPRKLDKDIIKAATESILI